MDLKEKEKIMFEVLKLAREGRKESNASFAAIIVDENLNIISSAYNKTKIENDITAHAEILALRKAGHKIKNRKLEGLKIFTNAEPCDMCMAAILKSGIREIYTGVMDTQEKPEELSADEIASKIKKEELIFEKGILEEESLDILSGR